MRTVNAEGFKRNGDYMYHTHTFHVVDFTDFTNALERMYFNGKMCFPLCRFFMPSVAAELSWTMRSNFSFLFSDEWFVKWTYHYKGLRHYCGKWRKSKFASRQKSLPSYFDANFFSQTAVAAHASRASIIIITYYNHKRYCYCRIGNGISSDKRH